jgi:hypothetical protein
LFSFPETIQAIEEQACEQIWNFIPQNIVRTLSAYAKLKMKPGPRFISRVEEQSLARILEFNSLNIADLLHAYGKIGIKPGQKLLAGIEDRIVKNAGAFDRLANTEAMGHGCFLVVCIDYSHLIMSTQRVAGLRVQV